MMEQTPLSNDVKKTKKVSMFYGILLLLLLALIGYASFWNIKNQKKIALQQTELQALFQQQQQFKYALSEQQQLQQVFAQQISAMMNNNQQTQVQIFVQEISILLHLADIELRVYHASDRALKILQQVEKRLQENPNKQFQALLAAINLDQKDLQQEQTISLQTLELIYQLQKTLKDLPVTPPQKLVATSSETPNTTTTSSWKEKVHANWQALGKLVVVRRFENSHPQILSEHASTLLKQQVISLSSLLIWAVSHQDNTLFQQTLEQIDSIVRQNFAFNQTFVDSVHQQITILQKKDISQTVANITRTLNALSELEIQMRK